MKNLLILGAGGMGKVVYSIATHSIGYGIDFAVKGFLDFENTNWDTSLYPSILCMEDEYKIQKDDVFVCSIGDVILRRKVCEKMKARGAEFYTLIHNNAIIGINAKIGDGTIVAGFATIGNDAKVGENCLIQGFSTISHDCEIGNYTRIDAKVSLVGGVKIGSNVTIHTNAVINHRVVIEDDAKVAALSFVVKKVKSGTTVMGNPAKKIDF